ncbi:MarR family transcriptional regulator [Lentisphaera profundi]|uniref:MarR family transcriptional regulator n=1 Tax=Lentisphaera profundi TaxID=1658616 RepID=A0ABY7VW39_9BACT|nr:MarR family transcriptional regulator [Lentisphaera profundi]WDE97046.1 MarR family transcriptional regulator [Lentisphaera profundi]
MDKKKLDKVDLIIKQWKQERPELELSGMETIGRLKRCTHLVLPRLEEAFSDFDLAKWEFDVLATLRRSGKPYSLVPTTLFSSLMISSGTMTHRIKRLEAKGLIERRENIKDARSKFVKLTTLGLELINQAVASHVENERQILAKLSDSQLKEIDSALKVLLSALE